ncbi:DNA recombination protein RmuC [Halopseudomonas salegens]|uniref:DNA recombination protein RmuC n=1 Tax=Halopseudomonas salegens TaxID=1434072 RepID=A0A1H2G3G5_9GAMM|nr:DNA recombination protein RmuC [Halopseudomonas salegens]SDU14101.1 DNA recombination protein RmuC [Halopseudomonas salegens]
MPASTWTVETISLLSVAILTALSAGYLLAAYVYGRRIARQGFELEQLRIRAEQQQAECLAEQAERRQTESRLHQQELAESRLQEQLRAAEDHASRLRSELEQLKAERETLRSELTRAHEQRHETEKQVETLQARLFAEEERASELRERLTANSQLDSDYQALREQHAQLKTTLERREEHFKEQLALLAETRQSMTQEFENLANRIFEEKGKTFTHTSQASIDHLLKPFREQITGFQQRINEVHDAALRGNSSLGAEIRKVLDIGLQMSKEANNLTSALKGDSQQRGAWGEAQLRRTLEMSGLMEDAHFETQSSFKTKDGKNRQTDYLIKLPDGKHIIIDSKVSLLAYERAVSAETPELGKLAMDEHIKAVRRHIDELAAKDYTNLVGMRSPSFVLMFMPIEPAYIEALKNNRDLFEYGYNKGIVLVSHTTLIPILRTVSNLWMIERSNTEAREISEKAGEIYNQVGLVAERLSKLGVTLATVSNHYNNTVTALAGKQGLYGKVDRFSQLSAKASKSLPSLEPAHMDFEHDRLALVVEAIPDKDDATDST